MLLILLERANFLRFAVTFPAGLVMVLRYGGSGHPALLLGGIALSILGTVLLQLLVLCIYILSFWFKKMDTCADISRARFRSQSTHWCSSARSSACS